jgi:serine/threonine protein kinase/tetratricopeptide (TPR) repeat protein
MAGFTTERWRVLSPYLDQALDLEVEEREPWLASLRLDNPSLATDLEELLGEREALDESGFLEGTADVVPPPPSLAGLRVGAYTLVSPIGRGGMGTVWLAERSDGRFTRKAAVKLLNTAFIGRSGEARFKHEGRLLARLTHPHIAHLIDAGVTSMGQPYLVLELVDGEHIDQYCARLSLDVEARVRLFIDVLEAVAHAHGNLIVHRDIKPSNVLVRSDGVVKLLDFGIAKLLESDGDAVGPSLTMEGARALTPEYAAPEQLTGGAITTATDVHALGMLFYVLLGGPHPAAGTESAAELVKVIVETDPPRLSDVVPDGHAYRGDLDNILAKALKKRPGERYASVTAFADDLRRFLRHEPVSARADTLAYRTSKFLQRRAAGVATAAVVLLVIAGLVGFYTVRLTAERNRARLEADKSAKMSDLLTSLLYGADPFATHDREPTVRNILDAGAERVQQELGDQPELKAEMLTVIGRVYQRLGMLDTAAPLLEDSMTLGRRTDTTDTTRMAQTLNEFGILIRERGDPTGAVPLLQEALAMRRRLLGNEDKDVAVTLVELGRAFADAGMNDRAEPLFREALDMRRRIFGERHRETSTSKSDLGQLLRDRGDIAAAEPLLREALETSRALLGEDHPNVGAGWNNLGLVLFDQGNYAGAEEMFRRAQAIRRLHFGERHYSVENSTGYVAMSLREQGKLSDAAALFEDPLALARQGHGDNDPAIAKQSFNLARVHLMRGDHVAAEPLLRDALHRQQRTMKADDWRLAATRSALGEALTASGSYQEAERLLTEAQAVLKDVPGRQGREAVATRDRLAALAVARAHPR